MLTLGSKGIVGCMPTGDRIVARRRHVVEPRLDVVWN
jgi:hypothetical protein